MWQYVPALGRWRQKDLELKTNLGYRISLRPVWLYRDTVSKTNKQTTTTKNPKNTKGWRCSSVSRVLTSMPEALGSILVLPKKKKGFEGQSIK
jgi:hypothetical protein